MATDNGKPLMPPYVPFKTFLNFLTKLEQVVPQRIDRSFLNRYYSGAMGSQLITSLRFLGLVEGDDNRTTVELDNLVQKQEERKQLLGELLHRCYAPVFTDVGDLSKATHMQLEQAFKQSYNVESDSRRKAISFFVHAAQYADIPISMYIRTSNNPGSSRTITRSTPKRTKTRQNRTQSTSQRVKTASKTGEAHITTSSTENTNNKTKTVTLESGGKVTLTYSVDLFDMNEYDREFLFGLIDQLRNYEQGEVNDIVDDEDEIEEENE